MRLVGKEVIYIVTMKTFKAKAFRSQIQIGKDITFYQIYEQYITD